MLRIIVVGALFVIVGAEYHSYRPRGWRPAGRPFEPGRKDRLRTYNDQNSYGGYTLRSPAYDSLPVTTVETPITTKNDIDEAPRVTTPRSREPTTSPDLIDDRDYDTSPVLAVANSFAFNRPIYVYNTFPLHSPLTFVK